MVAHDGGMVDVSAKNVTLRMAKASSSIILGDEAFTTLKQGTCVKGDVLVTAKIAAINAVKSTSTMCHPILIEGIDVDFELNDTDASVTATVTVKSSGKTGVEMEALAGASVACLTIYDMLKYQSRGMVIERTVLLEKTGGKSGSYKRPD